MPGVSEAPPIRGLLLDAGGVLFGPIGGRWNPRFDFERVIARFDPALDPARDPARFAAAVDAGEELGCEKPDPRMYAAGSAGIGVPPAECLFVDDYYPHVEAAIALGYRGVALGRTRPHPTTSVSWIDSLEGVLDLLGTVRP